MDEERNEQLLKNKNYFRVQAIIDLHAIRHNVAEMKQRLHNNTKLMVIIKADGYGHGAVAIAKALEDSGVDGYGVAIIEEAIELREAGITKPILILGYTAQEQYPLVVAYDITQTVFRYEMAEELNTIAGEQGKIAHIHIKLDTGMSRIGFSDTQDSINTIKNIAKLDHVRIEGLFSHFACADEVDKTSSEQQLKRFLEFSKKLENENIVIPIKHISNSAGAIEISDAQLNMVRYGIATYGLYPSEWVDQEKVHLIPAVEIKSHIIFLKEVEAEVGVSYGSTYITKRKTKIATIPVGYADGYSRSLSNRGRVIIRGTYAPIIGRICMDQFMVDVTDIEGVMEGDTVTLIGKDQDAYISVEEVAELSYSFSYELICNIGKRVPRVYLGEIGNL
ncbi:MAG: alr2 [Herbinix sp.]|nr:alr2 [Herbinix sp.]